MFLRRNRLAVLLAALAMALQALWPLVAQARPRIAGELVPVCTVEGVTHYLELPAGKSPLEERSATHGEHCKLCVFGNGKAVAVRSPGFSAFLLAGNAERSAANPSISSYPSFHLLPAQPRAPPGQF